MIVMIVNIFVECAVT